jgi:hypothetical protein
MISGYTEDNIVSILHKGLVDGIRQKLKARLMNDLEKQVDGAIDDALKNMQGWVESHLDHRTGDIVFNILVKK